MIRYRVAFMLPPLVAAQWCHPRTRLYIQRMVVAPEARRWESLFAARTRGDVGDGVARVLAFLGRADVISFAGGFPDPLTFPRARAAALLAEFVATGESNAFQYAPTRGLAGTLDALADRLGAVQGQRPEAGREKEGRPLRRWATLNPLESRRLADGRHAVR